MIKRLKGNGGFTLIEIVIVLAIIAILAGILTPTLTRYVGDSRIRKAEADVQSIAAAIGLMYGDTGLWPVWTAGTVTTGTGDFEILVSNDGEHPDDDAGLSGEDAWDTTTKAASDDLDDQLIINAASYNTTVGDRRIWRGPYLEKVLADPWGMKYMVNVDYLKPANVGGAGPVFVLSAGPNKLVETEFEQTGPSFTPGGDDIVFRLK